MFARGRTGTVVPPNKRSIPAPPIQVAACVVRRDDGHILMARRRPEQTSPGFWEIPGGKVEPGERLDQAAMRELKEETGVIGQGLKPLLNHVHDFPTRRIHLSVFIAENWGGVPRGCENQELAWVDPRDPSVGPILASNTRVLARLALPSVVSVASRPASDPAQWARSCAARASACCAGAILLLDGGLPVPQRQALVRRLETAECRTARTVWACGVTSANKNFAIEFSHMAANRRPASSKDPLRGAVLSLSQALAPGALDGVDVAIIRTPNSDKGLLSDIRMRASGAVYALVEDEWIDFTNFKTLGVDGICITERHSNANTHEVFV